MYVKLVTLLVCSLKLKLWAFDSCAALHIQTTQIVLCLKSKKGDGNWVQLDQIIQIIGREQAEKDDEICLISNVDLFCVMFWDAM